MTVLLGSAAAVSAVSAPAPGVFGTGAIGLSDRYGRPDFTGLFAADVQCNSYLRHIPCADATEVWLLYYNSHSTGQITIRDGVDNGTSKVPVWFDTGRDKTLEVGQWALGRAAIKLTKGTAFFTRTHIVPAAGAQIEQNMLRSHTSEQFESGTPVTDKTLTGTIGLVVGAGYGPHAVLYRPGGRVPATVWIGDSILAGGNTSDASSCFARTACAGQMSAIIAAHQGESAAQIMADLALTETTRHLLVKAGNHVVCQYGFNDIHNDLVTLATLQARWLAIWTYAAVGAKVWQTTITPKTNAGNTVTGSGTSVRQAARAWLRAGAPIDPTTKAAVAVGTSGALLAGVTGHPLAGIQDVSAVLEDENTGLWANSAYHAGDGIHLSDAGAAQMATGVDLTKFT